MHLISFNELYGVIHVKRCSFFFLFFFSETKFCFRILRILGVDNILRTSERFRVTIDEYLSLFFKRNGA